MLLNKDTVKNNIKQRNQTIPFVLYVHHSYVFIESKLKNVYFIHWEYLFLIPNFVFCEI